MKDALNIFASRLLPRGSVPGGMQESASGATAFLPPKVCLPALTGASDAFLALTLATQAESPRVILAITPGLPDADRLADDLKVLAGSKSLGDKAYAVRVLELPPPLDGDKSSLGTRLKTLAALKAWSIAPYPCIVVAAFPSLAVPVTSNDISGVTIALGDNRRETLSDLAAKLAEIGYRRVPMVETEGDFSVRGGILDAWSPGEEFPVRAEFFGEELESLRTFDPATQISVERISSAELMPIEVKEGENEAGQPTTDNGQPEKTLIDLLPPGSTLLALDHNAYSLPTLSNLKPQTTDLSNPSSLSNLSNLIFVGDPAPRGVPTIDFATSPLPGFSELGADEAHHPELFDAARKRLEQHLAAAEKRGDVILRLDDLSAGFELSNTLPFERSNNPSDRTTEHFPSLLVVTKADRVFAKKRLHVRTNAALNQGARLSDFEDLEPGEYVVHIDYGVGRYIGSSEIVVDGRRSEVFTIEYADGGKLHVPAAHAHLLSRYVGVKGEAVRLHRLDGKRWEKDKKEAQKAVTDLAAALLETQARRETVPGFAYDVECDGLDAFEAAFPYDETPDQVTAIAAIKEDLSKQKPMDRLICGDAGYGKTEVAMRAAFIAAMNGKQVAVLAPTTVLAEQHFETFTSRFDGTPIRIESVSRFQTGGTHKGTFQRIATGACDIVIGTHAILSNKICFHDLGLIIIDEEQRFGVRHKEFLKTLRATADVLTLSATPIPRTLYLSMTGARDLSLLRSPPRERVAVDTRIVRDTDEVIRTAITSELLRGGQVYFLHNRVADIGKVEKRLKDLFTRGSGTSEQSNISPRIVVAHGQMDSRTLARKMRDFERGEFDVLLSTTIIESGIDIPRANTILINQADKFGMADLYQLRGRVGRSARQGYAYFLLPPSGDIDSDARERLSALKRHGGLGSGFNLAVRDLELRGAGNLLGSQQSGHIAAVGFGLYCQLLQRTIAVLKGEKVKEIVDVKLNLDFANPRIPYEYIEEDVLRLNLMKRFAEAQDFRIVKALAAEMQDRFGPLPPEAKEYVRVAELRVACARAGIANIDVRGARAVFYKVGSRDIAFVKTVRGKTADRKLAELMSAVKSANA